MKKNRGKMYLIFQVNYGQSSGYIDINQYLQWNTTNSVRFLVWNWGGGYTYGFELWHGGTRIDYTKEGIVGVWGARENDQTRTNQWVYDRINYISF